MKFTNFAPRGPGRPGCKAAYGLTADEAELERRVLLALRDLDPWRVDVLDLINYGRGLGHVTRSSLEAALVRLVASEDVATETVTPPYCRRPRPVYWLHIWRTR